jgi:diguanylate cyclase (GGDEF)-like protein/PAS domain S-box-containing protein
MKLIKETSSLFNVLNEHEVEIEAILRIQKATHHRDKATGAHIIRVSKYSGLIARHLGYSEKELDDLMLASTCHDIGKIGIPDYILYKPGALTEEEFNIIKKHPEIGHDILKDSKSPVLREAANIALCHHEKHDGTGYPRGIKGDNIPLSAKIIAIADVFDSLLSTRSYKPSWNINQVIQYIELNKGKHFDPICVEVLIANMHEALKLRDSFEGDLSYGFDFTSKLKPHQPEERFQDFFQSSPVGIAMIDQLSGEFLMVNKQLLDYTGYTKEEFLKLTFWDITPKEYEFQGIQQMHDLNAYGYFGPNEKEYIRKDGTRFPIMIQTFNASHTSTSEGRNIVWGIIQDISKTKKKEDQLHGLLGKPDNTQGNIIKAKILALHAMALHDDLTGLPNRRLLADRVRQEIAKSSRNKTKFALIAFDIDKFKPVNDRFGHIVGDTLLMEISNRASFILQRCSDTICRVGGDEFIILLPDIDSVSNATLIANKIRAAFEEVFQIDGHSIYITCSMGIVLYPDHGVDELILFRLADDALYKSKNMGRNCISVSSLDY